MPYLGNTPTTNFASVTKDTFSGDASETAFTLSKPATTNGVAVYVENVRQIPTTAYAVSGTTLTFTGAPPSGTNNIYVMHHNTPVSTATHPAAQDLTAANATLTGAVTVGGTSNLTIADGDLVVGTSGHGISFSATSDGTTMSSELLDDYEEGLYTAAFTCGTSGTIAINSSYDQMSYTKIGRIVTVTGSIVSSTVSSPVGSVKINLPFTIASQTEDSADFAISVTNSSLASNNVADVQGNGSEGDAFVELTLGDAVNPQADLANQYSGNETLHLGFTYIAA